MSPTVFDYECSASSFSLLILWKTVFFSAIPKKNHPNVIFYCSSNMICLTLTGITWNPSHRPLLPSAQLLTLRLPGGSLPPPLLILYPPPCHCCLSEKFSSFPFYINWLGGYSIKLSIDVENNFCRVAKCTVLMVVCKFFCAKYTVQKVQC